MQQIKPGVCNDDAARQFVLKHECTGGDPEVGQRGPSPGHGYSCGCQDHRFPGCDSFNSAQKQVLVAHGLEEQPDHTRVCVPREIVQEIMDFEVGRIAEIAELGDGQFVIQRIHRKRHAKAATLSETTESRATWGQLWHHRGVEAENTIHETDDVWTKHSHSSIARCGRQLALQGFSVLGNFSKAARNSQQKPHLVFSARLNHRNQSCCGHQCDQNVDGPRYVFDLAMRDDTGDLVSAGIHRV